MPPKFLPPARSITGTIAERKSTARSAIGSRAGCMALVTAENNDARRVPAPFEAWFGSIWGRIVRFRAVPCVRARGEVHAQHPPRSIVTTAPFARRLRACCLVAFLRKARPPRHRHPRAEMRARPKGGSWNCQAACAQGATRSLPEVVRTTAYRHSRGADERAERARAPRKVRIRPRLQSRERHLVRARIPDAHQARRKCRLGRLRTRARATVRRARPRKVSRRAA